MKKYLFILIMAIISILPTTNVKAEEDLIFTYSFANQSVYYDISYNSDTQSIDILDKNHSEIYNIFLTKKNFILEVYGNEIVIFQSDHDFYIDNITNSDYLKGCGYSRSAYLYNTSSKEELDITYTNIHIEGASPYTTITEYDTSNYSCTYATNWSQYFTNTDIYNIDGSVFYEKNLDINLTFNNSYIDFEYELNNSDNSYDIKIFSTNFNADYVYRFKFDNNGWTYITSVLSNGVYNYKLLYDSTLYLEVYDENIELLESKSYEFTNLISKEEFYSPTIDINVACSTDFYTDIEQAKINLTFNNYSTDYIYQYSFDDINYININNTDIINKKYTITSHVNGPIFVKILDNENNLIYKNSARIDCILESENYYYYELTIDDLYNYETNELIYYTFLYENKKRDITPFVYFYYIGTDVLNFHINYDSEVSNFDLHYNALTDNSLNDLSCTTLPFEYIDDNIYSNNYTTYTMFSFMPCIDLSTFLYGEQYTDFKLIVKSNLKLDIGKPINIPGGAFLPSTNKPIDNSNYDSPFLDYFNNFVNEDFGLSAIVQAPLSFVQNLTIDSCTTLTIPIPYLDSNLELPCMSSIYEKYFGSIYTLYQTITTGVIAYWVCVKIFALVKDFHDPQNDKIEVMDL